MGDRTYLYKDLRVLGGRAQSAFLPLLCSINAHTKNVSSTRLCTLREYQEPDSNGKVLL